MRRRLGRDDDARLPRARVASCCEHRRPSDVPLRLRAVRPPNAAIQRATDSADSSTNTTSPHETESDSVLGGALAGKCRALPTDEEGVMELNSLTDVLVEELGDLYSAEQQLVEALPKLAAAAHSYELREAFESHLEETRVHVERLQQAFAEMSIRFIPKKISMAMQGLIEEGDDIVNATGDSVAIDAALIGAGQRVEHYEIASYGTARALAAELGLDTTSSLLDETLDEEGKANKTLTKLAAGGMLSSGINRLAAERSDADPVDDEVAGAQQSGTDVAAA
jgi:ferritin-like metal-binding protein YciE